MKKLKKLEGENVSRTDYEMAQSYQRHFVRDNPHLQQNGGLSQSAVFSTGLSRPQTAPSSLRRERGSLGTQSKFARKMRENVEMFQDKKTQGLGIIEEDPSSEKIHELEGEVTSLKNERADLQAQIHHANLEVERLRNANQAMKTEIEIMKVQNGNLPILLQENQDLKQEIRKLKSRPVSRECNSELMTNSGSTPLQDQSEVINMLNLKLEEYSAEIIRLKALVPKTSERGNNFARRNAPGQVPIKKEKESTGKWPFGAEKAPFESRSSSRGVVTHGGATSFGGTNKSRPLSR